MTFLERIGEVLTEYGARAEVDGSDVRAALETDARATLDETAIAVGECSDMIGATTSACETLLGGAVRERRFVAIVTPTLIAADKRTVEIERRVSELRASLDVAARISATFAIDNEERLHHAASSFAAARALDWVAFGLLCSVTQMRDTASALLVDAGRAS